MSLLPSRRRLGASLAVVVLVALAVGGCGDDDDSAGGDEDATTTTRPTTTESESSGVEGEIEELLQRYDDVTAQIVADPDVSADRDHPLYADLGSLLVPDTEMTEAVINALVQSGQRGEYQLPVEDAEIPVERRLDGPVETVSSDEVTFPLCTVLRYRRFDGQGRQREILPGLAEPGQGFAIHIDGEWRLSRLDTDERNACEGGQT
jgi:hypothetical protein